MGRSKPPALARAFFRRTFPRADAGGINFSSELPLIKIPSNAGSTFNMVKAKFGERVRSKTQAGQKNEVLCKILCHNVCCLIQSIYELGVEPSFWNDNP
jgi:hypothetical protein